MFHVTALTVSIAQLWVDCRILCRHWADILF